MKGKFKSIMKQCIDETGNHRKLSIEVDFLNKGVFVHIEDYNGQYFIPWKSSYKPNSPESLRLLAQAIYALMFDENSGE